MRPTENKTRENIILAKQRKEKREIIALWLNVSISTVDKVWHRFKETGSYLPIPYTGRKNTIDIETDEKIRATIEDTPDITLEELIDELSLPLTTSGLSRKLDRTGYYGRAKTNERIKEGVKDVRFERQSILSTMPLNGKMCPLIFEGTLNKELFADYLRNQLAPTLTPNNILLLDNSSVHRSKLVAQTLEECGIKHIFLPPYSPDLNPIELLWAKIKSVLRKLKARTRKKLEKAIVYALSTIELDFIANWFKHCGYVVNSVNV